MSQTVIPTPQPQNPMWATILQLAAPYGVELIDYIINLIQKEAQGQPITAEDWRGLSKLHAAKTAAQDLDEAIARSGVKA